MIRESITVMAMGLVVALAGCKTDAPTSTASPSTGASISASPSSGEQNADTQKAEQRPSPRYSSFGVKLHGGTHFNIISFKDVGLPREDASSAAPLLEAIAQSVAYELKAHPTMELEPEVVYNEELSDPRNHRACERKHLYVDMWRSRNPARWGYSLWSGCGESGKFAWDEVPVETRLEDNMVEAITPLGKGIVESFAEARQEGCFTRQC